MRKTAIAEKLEAKGITVRVVALRSALALFRNNGGTFEEAIAEVHAAFERDDDISSFAGRVLQVRSTAARMGSEAVDALPQGHKSDATASLSDAAKGQAFDADKAALALPDAATRKPGHARRGADAIRAIQPTLAKTLFDTVRLPGDDRAIGDITWKELQGLARKHAEAYRLLSLIDGYGQPADQDAMVRDVLKEDVLREFVEIARLANVH